MSDGPHRSLPLGREWKRVMERACNEAFASDEVEASLDYAIRSAFTPDAINDINALLFGAGQRGLFPDSDRMQLEAIRARYRADPAAEELVDCAIGAFALEASSVPDIDSIVQAAASEYCERHLLAVEEHAARASTPDLRARMMGRLDTAARAVRMGLGARLVRDLVTGGPARPPRRDSADDGPPL